MLNLDRIAVFALVANEGGYAKAARAASYPITQSALHQQVRKLEAEVGINLLERIGKDRMQPTDAGRRLLAFAAPFLRGLPTVIQEIRGGHQGGTLTLHAESLLIRHLLPDWLHRLRRQRPDAEIHLQELVVADYTPLLNGTADVLLAHLPDPPATVATEQVAELHACIVLPHDEKLTRFTASARRALTTLTFLAYPAGSQRAALQLQALSLHKFAPARIMHLDTADLIIAYIESGLGWSLLPSLDPAGPQGRRIQSYPLRRPRRTFPVCLAWRKDHPEHPLLDALMECATQLGRTKKPSTLPTP